MLHIGRASSIIRSGTTTHGARRKEEVFARKERVLDLSLPWIFHKSSSWFVDSLGQASSYSVVPTVSTLKMVLVHVSLCCIIGFPPVAKYHFA